MSDLVSVSLGERSYDIHIGSGVLQNSGKIIADLAGGALTRTRGETEFRERVQGLIDQIESSEIEGGNNLKDVQDGP